MGKMKISCCWLYAISKYGYPPSLENTKKVLKEMKSIGFKYVELEGVRNDGMKMIYQHREELKDLCNNLGLKIINFCPILPDIASMDSSKREKAFEAYHMGVETARYFEAVTVQTDSFVPPLKFLGETPYKDALKYGRSFQVEIDPDYNWNDHWNIIVDSYKKCTEIAAEDGLKFCLEPRVGELISNTDAFLRLSDAIGNSNFGMVLDTAHQHAQKEILPFSVEKTGDKIFYLHVADNDGKINEHLACGRGNIDFPGIFTALKKHDFSGYVAIDVGNVDNIDEQYLESVKYLSNLFEQLQIDYEI